MKKIFVSLLIAMMITSVAFAADFAPTLLKLTAAPIIQYDFDGSNISIPYTVSGHTAGVLFLVFTKGKADQIPDITNGFLGWHQVNKVDTCMYASTLASVNIGANTIAWNGKDDDGGVVPPGEYTYYLWAFDNQGAKEDAARPMPSGWGFDYTTDVAGVDEDGLPMANPLWFTNNRRWIIGNDALDVNLVETTDLSGALATGWAYTGEPTLHPSDYNYMYAAVTNTEAKQGSMIKYKWVPNGVAEIQTDWGEENGYATIFSKAGGGSCGTAIIGEYLFTSDENHVASTEPDSQMYIYDMDGYQLEEFDLTPWWSDPDALEVGAQMNGGPNNWCERGDRIFLNCHCNCLNQMIDPLRYMESGEADDMIVWSNGNGDYTLDHNFEDTATLKWVCNDYNVGPYKYCISPDGNKFTAVCGYDVGAVSFGLMAPDGTGLGYLSYAGETAGWKKGEIFIDSDTAYDGCYTDNEQTMGPHYDQNLEMLEAGIFFIGHDSISGIITNAVAVAEAAPAAFSVAQNAPNPFNPTTTISFKLAEAGDVSVDVFNVAGQKINTITDGFMDAGSHSVVWDASDFSAGVYFYTVKSGNHSKTMKMTLVK